MADTDDIQALLRGMRLSVPSSWRRRSRRPGAAIRRWTPEECKPYATPVPRQIIGYHYVASGQMLLKVPGQPPLTVDQGEMVVLPRNDPHGIGSALTLKPVDVEEWITFDPNGLMRLEMGGGGVATKILCGFLGDDLPYNPVLAMLPSVLKQNVAEGASGSWAGKQLRQAATELADGKVGSTVFWDSWRNCCSWKRCAGTSRTSRKRTAPGMRGLRDHAGGARLGPAARPDGAALDHRRPGGRDRPVTFGLRRPLHQNRGRSADALSGAATAEPGLPAAEGQHRLHRQRRV